MTETTATEDDEHLVEGADPYGCADCLAVGDACGFHAGFAAGWDACAVFVASAVGDHGDVELVDGDDSWLGGW